MLSTFPATFPSETILSDQFPSLSDCLPQCDCSELISSPDQPKNSPVDDSIMSTSTDAIIDERKRKRKISNRESARRSRMRKQKHLENLANYVNKLRYENRGLTDRLRFVISHCHRVMAENEQLRFEQLGLRQRLAELRQILVVRQMMLEQFTSTTVGFSWPCNSGNISTSTTIDTSEKTLQKPSLITY